MKSIIKYIIGGMGLLSITSCSDFLDQSSPSEIKGDMVFNSLTFTEQSLNKVYAGLTLDHTYGARIPLNFGFNTDIELVDADVNKPASFTESSERALGNYNGESISGGTALWPANPASAPSRFSTLPITNARLPVRSETSTAQSIYPRRKSGTQQDG